MFDMSFIFPQDPQSMKAFYVTVKDLYWIWYIQFLSLYVIKVCVLNHKPICLVYGALII